jgi:hypothetical protein
MRGVVLRPAPSAGGARMSAQLTAKRAAAVRCKRRDMVRPCPLGARTSKFCAARAASRPTSRPGGTLLGLATRWLLLLLVGSAAAFGCGEPNSNDFGTGDGSAGQPPNEGGTAGSSQGGSAQGGSGGSTEGGSSQGGSSGTGGSSQGGAGQGGSEGGTTSGGTSAGGSPSGGNAGTTPIGGTGNVSGTGQGGSSGASGRGGSGGGGDCDSIVAEAQAALQAAQVCDPLVDGPKCTGTVEDLCDCTVPVNNPDSEATKNYLRLREPAIACGVPCLAIVCQEPTTATCGSGGVQPIIGPRSSCTWFPR